jgi:hypothetical protein
MSLLKLSAFGAEVLFILQNEKEWNSDTLDLIQDLADVLGLADSDDGGMFDVCPDYKTPACTLFEDYEIAIKKKQDLTLSLVYGDDKETVISYGTHMAEPSGVTIRIGKSDYEL